MKNHLMLLFSEPFGVAFHEKLRTLYLITYVREHTSNKTGLSDIGQCCRVCKDWRYVVWGFRRTLDTDLKNSIYLRQRITDDYLYMMCCIAWKGKRTIFDCLKWIILLF